MGVRKEQLEDGCYLDGIGFTSAHIAASQAISLKRIADAIEKIALFVEGTAKKPNAASPKR